MKALIVNNEVVQITDVAFETHKDAKWVDCDSKIEEGYIYSNGIFSAPVLVEETYSEKRSREYNVLNQFELISDDSINGTTTHKDAILAIKAKYPKPE